MHVHLFLLTKQESAFRYRLLWAICPSSPRNDHTRACVCRKQYQGLMSSNSQIDLTTMLCSLLKAVFTKLQRAMERGFKTQYEWLFETCQLLKNVFLAFWVPHPLSPLQIFESIVFFSGCFSHFKQQWMLVKRSLFGNKVSGSVKDWQMFHLANSIS